MANFPKIEGRDKTRVDSRPGTAAGLSAQKFLDQEEEDSRFVLPVKGKLYRPETALLNVPLGCQMWSALDSEKRDSQVSRTGTLIEFLQGRMLHPNPLFPVGW